MYRDQHTKGCIVSDVARSSQCEDMHIGRVSGLLRTDLSLRSQILYRNDLGDGDCFPVNDLRVEIEL